MCLAKCFAVVAPIPALAPVMITIFPFKSEYVAVILTEAVVRLYWKGGNNVAMSDKCVVKWNFLPAVNDFVQLDLKLLYWKMLSLQFYTEFGTAAQHDFRIFQS